MASVPKRKTRKKGKQYGHVRPKAPVISLDQKGRLGTGNVLAVANWAHSTLYNKIAAGKFPPPQKDGRSNFWTTDQVREALGL